MSKGHPPELLELLRDLVKHAARIADAHEMALLRESEDRAGRGAYALYLRTIARDQAQRRQLCLQCGEPRDTIHEGQGCVRVIERRQPGVTRNVR